MKITIFGTGYVGLVTGACLAEAGNKVICVDVDCNKITELNEGKFTIYEPNLDKLITANQKSGFLEFVTDAKYAINHSELIFITVNTPQKTNDEVNISAVLQVAKTIGNFINKRKIIIVKSTVPTGTTHTVKQIISRELRRREINISFYVASNPEFLQEGSAVYNFNNPDRIVVGTESKFVQRAMRKLYKPFLGKEDLMLFADVATAEFIKYVSNAMLATKISFINEMACLAEACDVNINDVCRAISLDPRIGDHFVNPGCGYGGSCLPKDVNALIKFAEHANHKPHLLKAVGIVNNHQRRQLFLKLQKHFSNNLRGKTIAIWGLAFKPNTSDVREASARILMEELWQHNVKIKAFDPKAMDEIKRIYGKKDDLLLVNNKEECLVNADALVICTEWKDFLSVDFSLVGKLLKNKVIFDGRNLFDYELLKSHGFIYYGIGSGDNFNFLNDCCDLNKIAQKEIRI